MWTKRGPGRAPRSVVRPDASAGGEGGAVLPAADRGLGAASSVYRLDSSTCRANRPGQRTGMATVSPVPSPSNEVLLDGHDGDLVCVATGVGQDPVDHGLLVGPVGESHIPVGLAVLAKPRGNSRSAARRLGDDLVVVAPQAIRRISCLRMACGLGNCPVRRLPLTNRRSTDYRRPARTLRATSAGVRLLQHSARRLDHGSAR